MRKEYGYVMVLLSAAAGLFGSGCGNVFMGGKGVRVGPSETLHTVVNPAEFIELRILEAGGDPSIPDRNVDPATARPIEDVVTNDDEIVFKNKIQLKTKPQFFVWHENALGQQIQEAHFLRRVQDLTNTPKGEVDRIPASFDVETRRWFVPLARLFEKGITGVDPSDIQLLSLDLLLKDSSKIRINIRFEAIGVMPAQVHLGVHQNSVTQKSGLDVQKIARYVATNGLTVGTDELVNPTQRKLVLWTRIQPGNPPATMDFIFFGDGHKTTPLSLYSVAILKDDKKVGTQEMSPGRWIRIAFDAGARVNLEWIAREGAGIEKCYNPHEIRMRTLGPSDYVNHAVRTNVALIREIRIADAQVPEQVATSDSIEPEFNYRIQNIDLTPIHFGEHWGGNIPNDNPVQCNLI